MSSGTKEVQVCCLQNVFLNIYIFFFSSISMFAYLFVCLYICCFLYMSCRFVYLSICLYFRYLYLSIVSLFISTIFILTVVVFTILFKCTFVILAQCFSDFHRHALTQKTRYKIIQLDERFPYFIGQNIYHQVFELFPLLWWKDGNNISSIAINT